MEGIDPGQLFTVTCQHTQLFQQRLFGEEAAQMERVVFTRVVRDERQTSCIGTNLKKKKQQALTNDMKYTV